MSKTILIVDDQPEIRKLIKFNLEYGGFNIIEASDVSKGIEIVKSQAVDLAIIDISISDSLDGLIMCKALKSNPLTAPIAVIIISGNDSLSVSHAASQAGCDKFLSKPFSILKLIESVEKSLT